MFFIIRRSIIASCNVIVKCCRGIEEHKFVWGYELPKSRCSNPQPNAPAYCWLFTLLEMKRVRRDSDPAGMEEPAADELSVKPLAAVNGPRRVTLSRMLMACTHVHVSSAVRTLDAWQKHRAFLQGHALWLLLCNCTLPHCSISKVCIVCEYFIYCMSKCAVGYFGQLYYLKSYIL